MVKNTKIYKILILMFFIAISSVISASSAEFNDSNDGDSIIEEYKVHPLFIASRGTFPEIIDQEWKNSVKDCWLSISTDKSLVEFDPSVYAVGGGELLEVYLSS